MSQTKARRKTARPPDTGEPALPAWLRHAAFTQEERKLYMDAAEQSALDVTHWTRQILNRAAQAVLGTPGRRTRRAPATMALVPRRGGHARRRLARR